jgi:Protein of unknown function (DUF2442)
MIRITELKVTGPFTLLCKFNNGAIKKLDVLPVIQQHIHLNGVSTLLNEGSFKKVRIGGFGEIVWDKIVKTTQDGEEVYWDYDISPEFAYENSSL